MLWTDLRILVTDTGRLWWRLLPQLLAIWLLGWLGRRTFSALAVILGDVSPWLTLVVFPLGILCELVAIVLILQACGRELGIRSLIPAGERTDDDRDAGVARLLAITLLPFLGLYAAFGHINDAAYDLMVQQMARYGVLADVPTVLSLLNSLANQHVWWLLVLVVGLYLLRRALDVAHDRTGRPVLGVAVALVETFFILLVIMGGVRVWQRAVLWFGDRRVSRWIDDGWAPVERFFALIRINLPELLTRLWDFVVGQVWPVLADTVLQPLVWLAVAAIIFGSNVMSLAELNRSVRDRVPRSARRRDRDAAREQARADRQAVRLAAPPPPGLRRVGSEAREAFLGDIDDKYLPTLHALRLVVRSGPSFLGSFVLVYAAVQILGNYLHTGLLALVGGHTIGFWQVFEGAVSLAYTLPVEPLRLCLLAVAFRRCLELFNQRSTASTAAVEVVPVPEATPEPTAASAAEQTTGSTVQA